VGKRKTRLTLYDIEPVSDDELDVAISCNDRLQVILCPSRFEAKYAK